LSFFLKTLVSVIIRRSFGRQFHSAGPEKEKARSANFCTQSGFRVAAGACLLNADQIDDSFLLTSSVYSRHP